MKRSYAQIRHSRNRRSSKSFHSDLSASSRSRISFTTSATAPCTRRSARLQLRVLRSGKVRTDTLTHISSQEMAQSPRLQWHPDDVRSLIYMLLDEQSRGLFIDGKPQEKHFYEKLAGYINNCARMNVTGHQVSTKVYGLRIDYRAFRLLKDQTGVGWDDVKNTVDADETWWHKIYEINKYCKNFRHHGLENYEELDTLFHNTYASGALGQASTHRAPTREECDRRMRQLRGITLEGDDLPREISEHMDSGGNVNNSRSGGVSMETSSGSRKRGAASVTGGRARRNALQASELEYLEELKELCKSKRQRHASGSSNSRGDDRMSECVYALEACQPTLSQAQYCLVVSRLSASRPLQNAFLAMTDERKNQWAHGCT